MIVRASLKLTDSGREYSVSNCSYGLFQETDPETGQPTSGVRSYFITLIIGGRDTESKEELLSWAAISDQEKDGKVVLYQSNTDAPFKKIKFVGGILVNFTEILQDARRESAMTVAMSIATRQITIGENNLPHTNDW